MAAAVWGLISAGVGHGRARGWMEEARGEAARLWVRGIEAGWREVVGAELDGGTARARLRSRREEGE